MKRNTNKQHTITKYPPWNYVNGCYTKDEWTDYSCVGLIFDNEKFTLEEYLLVEQRYINVILNILEELGCPFLRVRNLWNNWSESIKESENPNIDLPLLRFAQSIKKRKRIDKINYDKIIKLSLRGYLDIVLENNKYEILIEFGYDYYMYVDCKLTKSHLKEIVENEGLYLDSRAGRL